MDKEITVTLHGATRLLNSADGNPTWVLHTSEGDFRTGDNADVGYDIQNHTANDAPEPWIGKRVTLTVTGRARRVSYWRLSE